MVAKVPGSELARVLLADSLLGANWPGSEKARYPRYKYSPGKIRVVKFGRRFSQTTRSQHLQECRVTTAIFCDSGL